MRRSNRGGARVLFILAVLLIASAALRLTTGPAVAVALDLDTPDVLRDDDLNSLQQQADPSEEPFPEMAALLQDLRVKEAALREKEARLDAKAQALDALEARVRVGLADLQAAEQKLADTMMRAQTAAEDDLLRLTAVYENMKAERAAEVFKKMEPSFAAGFLGRMRPDAAAAILAGLEAEFAYAISVVLAGRNANVPIEGIAQ